MKKKRRKARVILKVKSNTCWDTLYSWTIPQMWNRKSWWWSALWNTLVSLLLAQLNEPNLFSDDVSVSCQIQLLQRVSQRKINGFVSWKSLQWRVEKSIIYHLVNSIKQMSQSQKYDPPFVNDFSIHLYTLIRHIIFCPDTISFE